jgi:glycine cleavage system H protein
MMSIPADLKYTRSHEWARREADGSVSVGITHHAQDRLGDLVFVEMPKVGSVFSMGAECGVVESVKAASDIYAPVSGEVIAVNATLVQRPEQINQDAYGAWMFRLQPNDPAELDRLLDAAGYEQLVAAEEH